MNKEEEDAHCAAREVQCKGKTARATRGLGCTQVFEEIGFDISPLIVTSDFVETVQDVQRTKLFIIAGVDEAVCSLLTHFPVSAFDRQVSLPKHGKK